MPDSKQLRVMKALTEVLNGINPEENNPATGEPFTLDVRRKVFRGKMILGAEIKLPAIALLESPTPFDALYAAEEGAKKLESWRLLVQGFATDDKDNPLDPAYDLKAAMEVQLGTIISVDDQGMPLFPERHMLGNLISGLTISQGVVRPPDKNVSEHAFCYIPLIVKLATDIRNPYTG